MRDYGKVHTSFWTSETIRSMSEDGRTLAMYLMTCPHGTIAGVFRLPNGYACDDLQWSCERVAKGFEELFKNGFATRCERTKWVFVLKHFDWNPPENPNQRKAAAKIAEKIPTECAWKSHFMRDCWQFFLDEQPEIDKPSETLSKPFLNQEQEQEQEQEKRKGAASPRFDPVAVDLPSCIDQQAWGRWVAYRRKAKKTLNEDTVKAQVKKLSEWAAIGHNPAAIIDESIANGWQGLFEPKHQAAPRMASGRQGIIDNYAAQAAAARGEQHHGQHVATAERDITGEAVRIT